MEAAVSECMKMDYNRQKEKGKIILKKEANTGERRYEIFIKLSVAPGESGQKVMSLDGESIGDQLLMAHRGFSLDQDVKQVENAVKKYLETK